MHTYTYCVGDTSILFIEWSLNFSFSFFFDFQFIHMFDLGESIVTVIWLVIVADFILPVSHSKAMTLFPDKILS